MTHLMNTYNRLPVAFTHGQGARLFDEQGKLVEEESEWSHLAQHYALAYAQEWLDGHPEEPKS